MTTFNIIEDDELEKLIKEFDARINCLRIELHIELKSFSNLLRISLNTIQQETFENLLERIERNFELERALDNSGGYTIDFIGDKDPKAALKQIVTFLKTKSLKLSRLLALSQTSNRKAIIVTDSNDVTFLQSKIRNSKIALLSHAQFRKKELRTETVLFYSFNGAKDFDFVYNLPIGNTLVLYEQEYQLYQKQLQLRKLQIENEVMGKDRFTMSGIPYEPAPNIPIQLSQTIDDIVNRIDGFSNYVYNGYKDESDSLLDDIEEKIIYRITLNDNSNILIDSNETVFTEKGDLIKVYKLKVGSKIRIYGDSGQRDHQFPDQSDHLISRQSDHRFPHQTDHLN